jgi:Signal peptidase, peptidase S26
MTQHNINWKQLAAAFTSVLTLSAALPYSLGELAIIIPPKFKGWVALAGLVATTILRTLNAATVSPYHLFVMGDNRFDAFDSRRFGPSPISSSLPKMR